MKIKPDKNLKFIFCINQIEYLIIKCFRNRIELSTCLLLLRLTVQFFCDLVSYCNPAPCVILYLVGDSVPLASTSSLCVKTQPDLHGPAPTLPPPKAFPGTYFPAGLHLSLLCACVAFCASLVRFQHIPPCILFHILTYCITGAQLGASSTPEPSPAPFSLHDNMPGTGSLLDKCFHCA